MSSTSNSKTTGAIPGPVGSKSSVSTNAASTSKASTSTNYLEVPKGEYDEIDSCETRGLKLTFRRRSTERVDVAKEKGQDKLQVCQRERTVDTGQNGVEHQAEKIVHGKSKEKVCYNKETSIGRKQNGTAGKSEERTNQQKCHKEKDTEFSKERDGLKDKFGAHREKPHDKTCDHCNSSSTKVKNTADKTDKICGKSQRQGDLSKDKGRNSPFQTETLKLVVHKCKCTRQYSLQKVKPETQCKCNTKIKKQETDNSSAAIIRKKTHNMASLPLPTAFSAQPYGENNAQNGGYNTESIKDNQWSSRPVAKSSQTSFPAGPKGSTDSKEDEVIGEYLNETFPCLDDGTVSCKSVEKKVINARKHSCEKNFSHAWSCSGITFDKMLEDTLTTKQDQAVASASAKPMTISNTVKGGSNHDVKDTFDVKFKDSNAPPPMNNVEFSSCCQKNSYSCDSSKSDLSDRNEQAIGDERFHESVSGKGTIQISSEKTHNKIKDVSFKTSKLKPSWTKITKSNVAGHQLSVPAANAETKIKRADSAPPPYSTSSTILTPSSPSIINNNSRALNETSPNLTLGYLADTSTPVSQCIESPKHNIPPPRPKSSPPIYFTGVTPEVVKRKLPVVVLDRLPSPVVELYSIRSLSNYNSYSDFSDSDINLRAAGSNDQCIERDSTSGELSGYDSDAHSKSSGKLRFTYRKVVHKKRPRKPSGRSNRAVRDRCNVDGEKYISEGVSDDGSTDFSRKIKTTTPKKSREKYIRASKRGIQYKEDDHIFEENNCIRKPDTFDSRTRGQRFRKGPKLGARSNTYRSRKTSQTKKWRGRASPRTLASGDDQDEEVNDGDKEKDTSDGQSLIDPRIKSMSIALLKACKVNQSAENIAFRKKQNIAGLRGKIQDKNKQKSYQSQKAMRAVDQIGRRFAIRRPFESFKKSPSAAQMARKKTSHCETQRRLSGTKKHSGSAHTTVKSALSDTSSSGRCKSPRDRPMQSKIHTNEIQKSSNRSRNVFESELFQGTDARNSKSSASDNENESTNYKQNCNITPKKWCDTKTLFLKQNDIRKERHCANSERSTPRRVMHCPKCRCRCRGNEIASHGSTSKQYVSSSISKDSGARYDFPSDSSIKVKSEDSSIFYTTNTNNESSRDLLDNFSYAHVKREVTSPSLDGNAESEKDDTAAVKLECLLREIKSEVTKDTDLMSLDYSKPDNCQCEGQSKIKYTLEKSQECNGSNNSPTQVDSSMSWSSQNFSSFQHPFTKNGVDNSCTISQCRQTLSSNHVPSPCEALDLSNSCQKDKNRTSIISTNPTHASLRPATNYNMDISASSNSYATPLFLYTHDTTCSESNPIYSYAQNQSPLSTKPILTVNKPLSIQINQSPDNSDYGSPPNLSEYSSPAWCQTPILPHRVNTSGRGPQYKDISETSNLPVYYDKETTAVKTEYICSLELGRSETTTTEISKTIPKITISSPMSGLPSGKCTPLSASPSSGSHSCFISPDLPRHHHLKSTSRSSSPFRSPSLLSPYKSPSRQNKDMSHKSSFSHNHRQGTEHCASERLNCHPMGSPNHARNMQDVSVITKNAASTCHHSTEEHDSDDSDVTLVYPTADQERRKFQAHMRPPSRRSSTGITSVSCNSALSSPSMRHEDSTLSPVVNSLEKRQSELSLMVSDLRENISKTKAMKRSRRTNSFSGDNKPNFYELERSVKGLTRKPSFERFMSIEPLMDSDNPYGRITRDMESADQTVNEHYKMLHFVSGLQLQPKSKNSKNPGVSPGISPGSVAETQIYGIENTIQQENNSMCAPFNKDSVENGTVTLHHQDHKKPKRLCDDSSHTRRISQSLKGQVSRKQNIHGNESEDDSDSDEKPLVVIENAESEDIIEGDEALKKVTSGTYNLPTGVSKRIQKRKSKAASGLKDKHLRISMRSLFTRRCGKKVRDNLHFNVKKKGKEQSPASKTVSRQDGVKMKSRPLNRKNLTGMRKGRKGNKEIEGVSVDADGLDKEAQTGGAKTVDKAVDGFKERCPQGHAMA